MVYFIWYLERSSVPLLLIFKPFFSPVVLGKQLLFTGTLKRGRQMCRGAWPAFPHPSPGQTVPGVAPCIPETGVQGEPG